MAVEGLVGKEITFCCVGGEEKHELKTSRSRVRMIFALLKNETVKNINNLCMFSFSSIIDNIKILMRPLTAAKRN